MKTSARLIEGRNGLGLVGRYSGVLSGAEVVDARLIKILIAQSVVVGFYLGEAKPARELMALDMPPRSFDSDGKLKPETLDLDVLESIFRATLDSGVSSNNGYIGTVEVQGAAQRGDASRPERLTDSSGLEGALTKDCSVCSGTAKAACYACEGSGRVTCLVCKGQGEPFCPGCFGAQLVDCDECDESREVNCEDCFGTGEEVDLNSVKDAVKEEVEPETAQPNEKATHGLYISLEFNQLEDLSSLPEWAETFLEGVESIDLAATQRSAMTFVTAIPKIFATMDMAIDIAEVDVRVPWQDDLITMRFHGDSPLDAEQYAAYTEMSALAVPPDMSWMRLFAYIPFAGAALNAPGRAGKVVGSSPGAGEILSERFMSEERNGDLDDCAHDVRAMLGWGELAAVRLSIFTVEVALALFVITGIARLILFNTPGFVFVGSLSQAPIAAAVMGGAIACSHRLGIRILEKRMRVAITAKRKSLAINSCVAAAIFIVLVSTNLV